MLKSVEDYYDLKSYSPLHDINEYIRHLDFLVIIKVDNDRVIPFYSYKFLATLQGIVSVEFMYDLFVVTRPCDGGILNNMYFTNNLMNKDVFPFRQIEVSVD